MPIKKVRCNGCGNVFETDADTVNTSCPTCGMTLKVNHRWEPEGGQYVVPAVKDLSKY